MNTITRDDARRRAAGGGNFNEAAQGEILVEGLPQVIEDAAEEQMVWNEYNRRTIEGPGRDKQGVRKTQFIAGAEVLIRGDRAGLRGDRQGGDGGAGE